MTDNGECNGVLDGEIAAEVGISDITTNKGHDVGPKLVEGGKTGSSLLVLTKTTSLQTGVLAPAGCIVTRRVLNYSARAGAEWARLLDEVDEDCSCSVVGETLVTG